MKLDALEIADDGGHRFVAKAFAVSTKDKALAAALLEAMTSRSEVAITTHERLGAAMRALRTAAFQEGERSGYTFGKVAAESVAFADREDRAEAQENAIDARLRIVMKSSGILGFEEAKQSMTRVISEHIVAEEKESYILDRFSEEELRVIQDFIRSFQFPGD